jgi:hypothetical protein
MTISSTTLRNSYSGNGSTTAFAYSYPINTTSEITVIERSALGAETVKAEGTGSANYGIADNGAAGGTVTMVTAPAAGTTLIILRNTELTQETDYVANDPFPAETHEDALDKLQMQTQELQEELDRSIKISRTNTMTSTEFTVAAADRASKILAFDSSGELSITQEIGTFKGTSATTTTAAFSIRDIVKGTTAAQLNNIYICIQASPIGTALTNTSYWVLIVDAVSAATSATAAASSASAASTSATAATNNGAAQVTLATAQVALGTTQANNSATSATASASSATAGASSASAAASSATAAAASFDAFDDIYLGAKGSAPSVDNDGDALTTGDQYFNTSANQLNIWNGSAWQVAAISASGLATIVGTETLTNKTLTSPKINENVAVTSTATELNLLDGATVVIPGKVEGTNFTNSLLVGHATTGTLSSAEKNVGVGIGAADALTSGTINTAIGYNALTAITGGTRNTAIGAESLDNNSTGQQNVAVGHAAVGVANNSYNVGVGVDALTAATGSSNTALGHRSGYAIVSGSRNITIGHKAGDNITSGDANVIIGEVDAASATGDRQLAIGTYDGSTTTTWITGDSNGQVKLVSGYIAEVALTDAATITWNAATQPVAKVTLGASRTLGLPANPVNGQFISLLIIQDGTGSRTITWNAAYEFAADTAPTLTATANLGDLFTFRYNGAKWLEVGRNLALTLS